MPTHEHRVRFDTFSETFHSLAAAYREALDRADRLRRRLLRAEDAGEFSYARKIERKLVLAEAELEAAGRAITAHTKATAVGAWKERRRPRREPVLSGNSAEGHFDENLRVQAFLG